MVSCIVADSLPAELPGKSNVFINVYKYIYILWYREIKPQPEYIDMSFNSTNSDTGKDIKIKYWYNQIYLK